MPSPTRGEGAFTCIPLIIDLRRDDELQPRETYTSIALHGRAFAHPAVERGSPSIHHRWTGQLEVPEHVDQRAQPLLAIGCDIQAGIVEEAGAGAQADAA